MNNTEGLVACHINSGGCGASSGGAPRHRVRGEEFDCIAQRAIYNTPSSGAQEFVAPQVAAYPLAGAAGRTGPLANRGRAWYFVAGALGLAAGLALSASGGSPPGSSGRTAASDVVVSSTALGDSEVVITILNVPEQRLAVYAADAKRVRLKLLAVRDISADMALTDYNNDPPLPRDIRARVDKGAEAPRPVPAPVGTTAPAAP